MFHILKKIFGMNVELTVSRSRKKGKRDDVFLSYLNTKISEMERNSHLFKGKNYARNSICNYRKILRLWPDFEKSIGVSNLRFSDITLNVYSGFMDFCDRRNYMESTKYQYIALVKAIMNSALDDGASSSNVQNNRGFVTHRRSSIYKGISHAG